MPCQTWAWGGIRRCPRQIRKDVCAEFARRGNKFGRPSTDRVQAGRPFRTTKLACQIRNREPASSVPFTSLRTVLEANRKRRSVSKRGASTKSVVRQGTPHHQRIFATRTSKFARHIIQIRHKLKCHIEDGPTMCRWHPSLIWDCWGCCMPQAYRNNCLLHAK